MPSANTLNYTITSPTTAVISSYNANNSIGGSILGEQSNYITTFSVNPDPPDPPNPEPLVVNGFSSSTCMLNLSSSSSSAAQYQRLKIIQNTVRVPSSLYSMNLSALTVYQTPKLSTQVINNSGSPYVGGGGVNWNQMSDRKIPHVQKVVTASPGKSSTRHTITRLRPGAGSPGGIGCDIKHNYYERYLNRMKVKKTLGRGAVPAIFGDPIVFNPARPIYGGKTMKTSIVTGCNQCDDNRHVELLYELNCGVIDPSNEPIVGLISVPINSYLVGDFVWAQKCKRAGKQEKAQIISISADQMRLVVKFADCSTMIKQYSNLKPYVVCSEHLYPISYVNNGVVTTCDFVKISELV